MKTATDHPLFQRCTPAQVLAALKAIRDDPSTRVDGICASLRFQLNGSPGCAPWVTFVAMGWEKYSGRAAYPVPHHTVGPGPGFDGAQAVGALWNPETQYGRDRLELLDFLIASLEG